MHDEYVSTFERLWVTLRAKWCDTHSLSGALAFTDDHLKIDFFHRVVQVNVGDAQVDRLIDNALELFRSKRFACAFTLSPLDRPTALAERLEQRGFERGMQASAMTYEASAESSSLPAIVQAETSEADEYEIWSDVMCQSFAFPPAMGKIGRSVLVAPGMRRYLARVDGAPAGTALLYSQFGMGYIDLVGTLPRHRRKGIASALVAQATVDSATLGNRWTSLETTTGSAAEHLYKRLGFRTIYHRQRYTSAIGHSV
ncbi:MAG: GNAT family N-acetyltransferase [Planctomycetota bacterium]|nr:GNAT family N-acetyltransferase [Planctomycetota bacterium]